MVAVDQITKDVDQMNRELSWLGTGSNGLEPSSYWFELVESGWKLLEQVQTS